MAGNGDQLYFRADDDLRTEVESYQTRQGYDHLSEATRELVEIGIRESQGSLLNRWRGAANTVSLYMACTALAVLVLTYGTGVVAPGQGLVVAFALAFVGLGILAAVELARVARGQSELGARLREGRA